MKGFSIIVCCYNSEDVIEDTLSHLASLHVPPGLNIEVILVDNCCMDHTVSLTATSWAKLGIPFVLKIVEEKKPGLSYARKKGADVAENEFLLFCDDDNRLSVDYLLTAFSLLSRRPEIGALGGMGFPDYENKPDYWPEDFYIYGCGPQAEKSREVRYVHGAGVVLRRAVFHKIDETSFKFLLADRKGEELSSGGDYEMCYAIGLMGYIIWYEETLFFKHYITANRMTLDYCKKFIKESAPAIDILDTYKYYLQCNRLPGWGFYLRQIKLVIYHGHRMLYSFNIKRKFKEDKQIVFLETFHILFHKARIICILKSLFRYKTWGRQIWIFKEKLLKMSDDS